MNKDELRRPPADNVHKINIDASFHADLKRRKLGFVIRNSMGEFLEGSVENIPHVTRHTSRGASFIFFFFFGPCSVVHNWADESDFRK